jgi:DNA-binding MarR family transcriptional regulator
MTNPYVTYWAWEQRVSPTQKLVLLAFAGHANEVFDCWPSEARLGELTGLPVRTVRRAVHELEAKGLILYLRLRLKQDRRICCRAGCRADWSGSGDGNPSRRCNQGQ